MTENGNDSLNIECDDQSPFEIIQRRNEENELRVTSGLWEMISTSIDDQSHFSQLKIRIKSFVRDHPLIVSQIEQSISNELIEHILKRTFRVQFTVEDRQQLNLFLQRFFTEHDQNIRIIFYYIIDDIRLLMLTGKFENIPWLLRKFVIRTPNSLLLLGTMRWLHSKGSDTFANMIFQSLLNRNEIQQEPFPLSFDHQSMKIILFVILFLLLSINISTIGFLVNSFCIFVVFIILLYHSLIYLKR